MSNATINSIRWRNVASGHTPPNMNLIRWWNKWPDMVSASHKTPDGLPRFSIHWRDRSWNKKQNRPARPNGFCWLLTDHVTGKVTDHMTRRDARRKAEHALGNAVYAGAPGCAV